MGKADYSASNASGVSNLEHGREQNGADPFIASGNNDCSIVNRADSWIAAWKAIVIRKGNDLWLMM
jgi:hypothetical protein